MTDHDSRFSRRGFLGGLGATLAAGAAGLLGRRSDPVDLAGVHREMPPGQVFVLPDEKSARDFSAEHSGHLSPGTLSGPLGLVFACSEVRERFDVETVGMDILANGWAASGFRGPGSLEVCGRLIAGDGDALHALLLATTPAPWRMEWSAGMATEFDAVLYEADASHYRDELVEYLLTLRPTRRTTLRVVRS